MPQANGGNHHRNDDDASHPHEPVSDFITPSEALPEQCAKVYAKVQAFLESEPRNARLKELQRQTRSSLATIAEALERYR